MVGRWRQDGDRARKFPVARHSCFLPAARHGSRRASSADGVRRTPPRRRWRPTRLVEAGRSYEAILWAGQLAACSGHDSLLVLTASRARVLVLLRASTVHLTGSPCNKRDCKLPPAYDLTPSVPVSHEPPDLTMDCGDIDATPTPRTSFLSMHGSRLRRAKQSRMTLIVSVERHNGLSVERTTSTPEQSVSQPKFPRARRARSKTPKISSGRPF